jgi:hydroxyacylglutathione hydrolase
MRVSENILFWTGMYAGSGYIIAEDTIIAVDAQSRRDQASLMIELLKHHGYNPQNVRYLVNTHNDFDHIGGNAEFLHQIPNITMIAGAEDSIKIENPTGSILDRSRFRMERVIENLDRCSVEVKVQEDVTLEINDLKLSILHTPGHTAGSICVYVEEDKALFTGDTVLGDGRWAGPQGLPLVRMDLDTMIATLERLSTFEVEWLLPGHGKVVRNGQRKIREVITTLQQLPEQVLRAVERASTIANVSDQLLAYPNTVNSAIMKLEKQGKIRKINQENSIDVTKWIAK